MCQTVQLADSGLNGDTSDDHDTEGFNVVSRSRVDFGFSSQPAESRAALSVLSTIRSARGLARQEYGRAHASLYPFYMDSIQVRVPSNARIFRVYRHPNEQAQIIAQIERFARSDFASGNTGRRVAFSTLVQAFEDAVSREFEQGMSLQDVDGRMKKYAHVLVTLNGGQRAAQCFVSANPIFRDAQAWGDPMDCVSSTHANVLLLEESTGFFQQVSTETRSQLDVIRRVFPPTLDVMHSLLLRVVNDLVRPYLCSLFDNTRQRDVGMFLEAVSGTYRRGLEFINSLNGPSCVSAESGQMRLSELVDNIYGPYFEAYLPRDLETFKEKSTTEIWRWEQQMSEQGASSGPLPASSVTRQAAKRDFLSSFKNVILAPVNALPALPWASAKSPTDVQSPGRPLGHDSHDLTRSATRKEVDQSAPRTTDALALPILEPNAEQVSDLAAKAAVMKTRLEHIKSLFSLELSLNLIQLAKASMERTAVFASASGTFHQRARSQCETVFVLLVRTLGSQHVQKGLDQAVEHLSSYNPSKDSEHRSTVSVAPLMVFFELVNVCDLIQQMLDVFFEQELVATRIVEPGDSLSPAIKEKKRFEQMLDDRVAAGLNRGIEVLMTEVEYVLSAKQRVEDFNPGASGSVITDVADVGPSNAALVIIEVVSGHTQMLKGSADKNILDVFNQEIGLRLFAALCKHLKRQRISVRGAIRLIRCVKPPSPSKRPLTSAATSISTSTSSRR